MQALLKLLLHLNKNKVAKYYILFKNSIDTFLTMTYTITSD